MKTKEQVQQEFKDDLCALLKKYGADIQASDHYSGYAECGQDVRMVVTIPAIYDDSRTLREWTEVDLGSYLDAGAKF